MFFGESTIRVRTRVRSAFGRLRPSKSSLELTTHMDSAPGQFLDPKSPLFLSPPVLNVPESLPRSAGPQEYADILQVTSAQTQKNPPKQASGTPVAPADGSCESKKIPALTQMLEQQGLTNSPISNHLASLVLLGDASDSRVSISTDPELRILTDTTFSSGLRSPSAGPFTPELVSNPVGTSTPEFSASYSSTPELGSSLSASSPTNCPLINLERSSLGLEVVNSQKDPYGPATLWISSPHPSSFTRKLSASPARPCLRRAGPTPSNHPISPQLLHSLFSTYELPRTPDHCDDSMNGNEVYAKRSSISSESIELECYSPGGNPMDKFTIDDDCDQKQPMAHHMKAVFLGHPPSIKSRRSAPELSESKRSSASSFMTNVTGYASIEH